MPSHDILNAPLPSRIEISNLKGCARCTLDHENVTFTKMALPIGDSPYWAPCPMNGDPILLRVQTLDTRPSDDKDPTEAVKSG